MAEHIPAGVMVYLEHRNSQLLPAGFELLGEALRLSRLLEQPLYAAVVGVQGERLTHALTGYPIDTVFFVSSPLLGTYTVLPYTAGLEQLVKQANPAVLLISATVQGRDLGARLASRLGTGLTADCTKLDIHKESGLLLQTRPAYGGNVMATILCKHKRPQMATVRPGMFLPIQPDFKKSPEFVSVPPEIPDTSNLIRVLSQTKIPSADDALSHADIIVSAGRGVTNQNGMDLIRQLAKELHAAVACSRGTVEDGLLEKTFQVGQTGKILRPRVYIACGISGAVQHLVGIREAEVCIAINKDPDAPIFQHADFGICGDLFTILPQLVEKLSQFKG